MRLRAITMRYAAVLSMGLFLTCAEAFADDPLTAPTQKWLGVAIMFLVLMMTTFFCRDIVLARYKHLLNLPQAHVRPKARLTCKVSRSS
jgi:hypothetical protein